MSRPPLQHTRLNGLQSQLGRLLLGSLNKSWRSVSLTLLALLLGFYVGQNLPPYLMTMVPGGRPALVLGLVLMVELVVRLRSRLVSGPPGLAWLLIDNARLGAVYAVVLEAFKLGS
jgi:hypothetical protein